MERVLGRIGHTHEHPLGIYPVRMVLLFMLCVGEYQGRTYQILTKNSSSLRQMPCERDVLGNRGRTTHTHETPCACIRGRAAVRQQFGWPPACILDVRNRCATCGPIKAQDEVCEVCWLHLYRRGRDGVLDQVLRLCSRKRKLCPRSDSLGNVLIARPLP